MNGLMLLETLRAAATGRPADCDPLTGLPSRARFLAAVGAQPTPRGLACIAIDPVFRGQPSRAEIVHRKMFARIGALMAEDLTAADHLVHWDPSFLVATFSSERAEEAQANLEVLRVRFADHRFVGPRGHAATGTLTAAITDWTEPIDSALAAALLRARSGLAAAQLRGGNCVVAIDDTIGTGWLSRPR